MAVFQSKYRELSFYVNGERHTFSNGILSTDDVEVVAALNSITDVVKVETDETELKSARKSSSRTSAK